MSDTDKTEDALSKLKDGEYVTEFQEGSNRAKMLTPADLRQLRMLEEEIALRAHRKANGIYRVVR